MPKSPLFSKPCLGFHRGDVLLPWACPAIVNQTGKGKGKGEEEVLVKSGTSCPACVGLISVTHTVLVAPLDLEPVWLCQGGHQHCLQAGV